MAVPYMLGLKEGKFQFHACSLLTVGLVGEAQAHLVKRCIELLKLNL